MLLLGSLEENWHGFPFEDTLHLSLKYWESLDWQLLWTVILTGLKKMWCVQHRQWLIAAFCVRNLNNTKKDKKMRCVVSHLFLGTGWLLCPIRAHEAPSPWTNRSRAHFIGAASDGEGPVWILSVLWWSHWLWEVSGTRSMDSDRDVQNKEGSASEVQNNSPHWSQIGLRIKKKCER